MHCWRFSDFKTNWIVDNPKTIRWTTIKIPWIEPGQMWWCLTFQKWWGKYFISVDYWNRSFQWPINVLYWWHTICLLNTRLSKESKSQQVPVNYSIESTDDCQIQWEFLENLATKFKCRWEWRFRRWVYRISKYILQ